MLQRGSYGRPIVHTPFTSIAYWKLKGLILLGTEETDTSFSIFHSNSIAKCKIDKNRAVK
jgi:hypothetical protein